MGRERRGNAMECILAWIFLVVGICSGNALYFIASGAFAIACQLQLLRRGER